MCIILNALLFSCFVERFYWPRGLDWWLLRLRDCITISAVIRCNETKLLQKDATIIFHISFLFFQALSFGPSVTLHWAASTLGIKRWNLSFDFKGKRTTTKAMMQAPRHSHFPSKWLMFRQSPFAKRWLSPCLRMLHQDTCIVSAFLKCSQHFCYTKCGMDCVQTRHALPQIYFCSLWVTSGLKYPRGFISLFTKHSPSLFTPSQMCTAYRRLQIHSTFFFQASLCFTRLCWKSISETICSKNVMLKCSVLHTTYCILSCT